MLLPKLSLRAFAIWQRNFLVWRKLAVPALLGNLADPMIYLFGLGYGLGNLLPAQSALGGTTYLMFLASGTVCASTMNAASFEALYSAFSRMHVQKTWESIMNAPIALDDIVAGETLWAASKATLSGCAILLIVALLGMITSPLALWALPVIFLTGLCFAALGLIVTALAPSYDFFMYYFTLVVTPMMMLCGVFFPTEQLPTLVQTIAAELPLSHSIALARPLLLGKLPTDIFHHVFALIAIAALAFTITLDVARRRLLS